MQKSLLRGDAIIISGKYGIGRTSLVRHIADINKDFWRFVFVNYSCNALDASRGIFLQLFPNNLEQCRLLRYTELRQCIARFYDRRRETVIVIDNIAKLSPQKLELLRYWKLHSGFQFIAITESFLPAEQLRKLRGCLGAASPLFLNRLPLTRVKQFVELSSQRYGLGLKDAEIRGIAKAAGGHPLSMTCLVMAERRRRRLAARS